MHIIPKLQSHFVSELDCFLEQFEKKVTLSASQRAEIVHQKEIARIRDGQVVAENFGNSDAE